MRQSLLVILALFTTTLPVTAQQIKCELKVAPPSKAGRIDVTLNAATSKITIADSYVFNGTTQTNKDDAKALFTASAELKAGTNSSAFDVQDFDWPVIAIVVAKMDGSNKLIACVEQHYSGDFAKPPSVSKVFDDQIDDLKDIYEMRLQAVPHVLEDSQLCSEVNKRLRMFAARRGGMPLLARPTSELIERSVKLRSVLQYSLLEQDLKAATQALFDSSCKLGGPE